MITVAEAISRLVKKYPNQRIVSGLDMGDFYAFSMLSRNVNPKSSIEMPVQPVMKAIRKKTGDEFPFHVFHSREGNYQGDVDVTLYLSAEDAAFSRKMKAMLEG